MAWQQLILWLGHFHCEGESGTPVLALRVRHDLAIVQVDQIAADHEAHPDPLTVDFGRAVQLAKLGEQLVHLFRLDAATSVDDVHGERLTRLVETRDELDQSFAREFHRVFDKIDQNLLQPDAVPDQYARQWCLVNAPLAAGREGAIHVRD